MRKFGIDFVGGQDNFKKNTVIFLREGLVFRRHSLKLQENLCKVLEKFQKNWKEIKEIFQKFNFASKHFASMYRVGQKSLNLSMKNRKYMLENIFYISSRQTRHQKEPYKQYKIEVYSKCHFLKLKLCFNTHFYGNNQD